MQVDARESNPYDPRCFRWKLGQKVNTPEGPGFCIGFFSHNGEPYYNIVVNDVVVKLRENDICELA